MQPGANLHNYPQTVRSWGKIAGAHRSARPAVRNSSAASGRTDVEAPGKCRVVDFPARSAVTSAPIRVCRLLVLGSPGTGKTSLATTLAGHTGLPLHHLDDEYWGPSWTRTGDEAWRRRQAELVAGDAWIVEGNYLPTIPVRAVRAQLVVVVDVPTTVCLFRTARRAWCIRRGEHDALPARIRAQARSGQRVRATKDFRALLTKVLWFRRRSLRQVLDLSGRGGADVVLAVQPGLAGHRLRAARRLCHGLAVRIVPLSEVEPLVTALCRTTAHHHRSREGIV